MELEIAENTTSTVVFPVDLVESIADAAAYAGWLIKKQLENQNVNGNEWATAQAAIDSALSVYFNFLADPENPDSL